MKVVLLQDVAKVGLRNDVKDVSDGYALNFLIPNGMAETATEKAIKRVEKAKVVEAAEKKVREDLLLKSFSDLKGQTITVEKVANKEGRLFASLHKPEIAAALKNQTRLDVDPDFIQSEAIKAVGEHQIEVKVGERAVKFTLKVNGLAEEHAKKN